ncbi:MAG TPA: PEP-CTERM sorting domain-containing protein [Armatimonadota bacterium]|jgi:hypothetical protein
MRAIIVAAALAALTAPAYCAVVVDTGGFEGYALGALAGQNGWTQVNAFGSVDRPVDIAIGPGGSKVMAFDCTNAAGEPNTEGSVQTSFANLTGVDRYARVTYDLYRDGDGIYNNLWWWPVGSNNWYGLQWDNGASQPAKILPFGFGAPDTPMLQKQWVNIDLTFDLVAGTEDAYINGTLLAANVNVGTGEFAGWFLGDSCTVDPARTPNGKGQKAYVDNLRILAGNTRGDLQPVPEPSSLALLAGGLLPLLGLRRRK